MRGSIISFTLAMTTFRTEPVDVIPISSTGEWREACPTIKDKLAHILHQGQFADVKFVVGQQDKREILSHRLILKASSSVFEQLLEGTNKSVTVAILDVEPEPFFAFLKFLYTDEFGVDVKDVTAVLYLAKKYQVVRLASLCAEVIKENISCKNVVSILLSAEALGEHSISAQARIFLKNNISEVIQEDDFLQLSSQELCQILASDDLVVTELELFNAALCWATEECKREKLEQTPANYRYVLRNVLPLIRFPLIRKLEFIFNVISKGILTDSECLNILLHYDVSPKERAALPPLMFSNKPRREEAFYESKDRVKQLAPMPPMRRTATPLAHIIHPRQMYQQQQAVNNPNLPHEDWFY